eukprot:6209730-Prorocentrum_lima.AAC.1
MCTAIGEIGKCATIQEALFRATCSWGEAFVRRDNEFGAEKYDDSAHINDNVAGDLPEHWKHC